MIIISSFDFFVFISLLLGVLSIILTLVKRKILKLKQSKRTLFGLCASFFFLFSVIIDNDKVKEFLSISQLIYIGLLTFGYYLFLCENLTSQKHELSDIRGARKVLSLQFGMFLALWTFCGNLLHLIRIDDPLDILNYDETMDILMTWFAPIMILVVVLFGTFFVIGKVVERWKDSEELNKLMSASEQFSFILLLGSDYLMIPLNFIFIYSSIVNIKNQKVNFEISEENLFTFATKYQEYPSKNFLFSLGSIGLGFTTFMNLVPITIFLSYFVNPASIIIFITLLFIGFTSWGMMANKKVKRTTLQNVARILFVVVMVIIIYSLLFKESNFYYHLLGDLFMSALNLFVLSDMASLAEVQTVFFYLHEGIYYASFGGIGIGFTLYYFLKSEKYFKLNQQSIVIRTERESTS